MVESETALVEKKLRGRFRPAPPPRGEEPSGTDVGDVDDDS